jgi:hypothetical protein
MNESRLATSVRVNDLRHSAEDPVNECNGDFSPITLVSVWSYSVMMRSAHSTSDTKTAGLPNFAPQSFRSVSVTPRAREQAPQEKTGICFPTTFSCISLRGGQPTGKICKTVAFRMR